MMSSLTPKVSVVIPTFNYAHYLDETIQSVLAQTYTDYELIIVDNHSTDNTEEVVKKYLSNPKVSFHRNPKNLGLTGNWNKCLEYAKGEYIKFLCADDKFHPQLLEKYVPIMEAHPNVSLITCHKQGFGWANHVVEVPVVGMINGMEMIYNSMRYPYFLGEPTLVMLRRSNLHVGEFKNFEWIVDWEMWVRHLALGDCYVIPETLCFIRVHKNQETQRIRKFNIDRLEEYYMVKAIQRKKYNVEFEAKQADIDAVVKMKAKRCAYSLYRMIPRLKRPEARMIFMRMLKIALVEKVLLSPVFELFRERASELY